MERLTMQEEDVMWWVWQIDPCFIKDILVKYAEPKPPYTTIRMICWADCLLFRQRQLINRR